MAGTERGEQIRLGSVVVRFRVRRSERARRLTLRVVPGRGLEVVLPRGVAWREATRFVEREQDWVLAALAKVERQGHTEPLSDGTALPYLGTTLALRITKGERTTARRVGDDLLVRLADGVAPADGAEAWYRAEARRVLHERVAVHAARLGVTPGRIAIKDTRSRWGSCSAKGNLNFSWRLLLAPFAVMDYVVAHEVAHLRELNHSPRFWATVEALCPEFRTHRAWLRKHGGTLAAWPGGAAE